MIVEFIGPPGAGKTTVGTSLSSLTSWPSITLDGYLTPGGDSRFSLRRVQLQRLWSLFSQPALSRHVFQCARTEGTGGALSWMINLARRNRMMLSLKQDTCILEEGTLSALCLAMASREGDWDPSEVLATLTYGDVVVTMDVDIATSTRRVIERKGILSELSVPEIERIVGSYNKNLDWVTKHVTVPVIHLSADLASQENAKIIIKALGL